MFAVYTTLYNMYSMHARIQLQCEFQIHVRGMLKMRSTAISGEILCFVIFLNREKIHNT